MHDELHVRCDRELVRDLIRVPEALVREIAGRWIERAERRGYSTRPELRVLGLAHYEREEYADAVAAYEHLLSYEYTDPRVYNDLGAVLRFDLDRDLDRAQQLFRTCIAQAEKELAPGVEDDARRQHIVALLGR